MEVPAPSRMQLVQTKTQFVASSQGMHPFHCLGEYTSMTHMQRSYWEHKHTEWAKKYCDGASSCFGGSVTTKLRLMEFVQLLYIIQTFPGKGLMYSIDDEDEYSILISPRKEAPIPQSFTDTSLISVGNQPKSQLNDDFHNVGALTHLDGFTPSAFSVRSQMRRKVQTWTLTVVLIDILSLKLRRRTREGETPLLLTRARTQPHAAVSVV